MIRFVVDESSWHLEGLNPDVVADALEHWLERLSIAHTRGEEAVLYQGFYDFDGVSPPPYEALFERSMVQDRDLRVRIVRALDRLVEWTDEPALDVEVVGVTLLAPSIAYAHDRVCRREAVACLPLITAGRAGPHTITVNGQAETVHFVVDEASHRAFFREAIYLENADDKAFPALAASAFPDLRWADEVWKGLGEFSKPFHDIRVLLSHHLAVLDDCGAEVCRDLLPGDWSARFGSHGVRATGENGKTMGDAAARRDRTRTWRGTEHVFWWHTKLQPNIDRIHILYDEESECVVIGIFKDHCYLPG